jgi:hypothetical protein
MSTEPLVKEIERAFPQGLSRSSLGRLEGPSTDWVGASTFGARAGRDRLRGLGARAARPAGVRRQRDRVDDMDAVIGLLRLAAAAGRRAAKARLIAAALRAAGVRRPPPAPGRDPSPTQHSSGDREAVRHHDDGGRFSPSSSTSR